jgi:putative ABC transport system permease protein
MTVVNVAVVVTSLVIMLAFVNGAQTVCARSGCPENVIVLSEGATDESWSRMDRQLVSQVSATPGVLRGDAGRPLASQELFMVINRRNSQTREYDQLQARGVYPIALAVHPQVRIIEGRMFRDGRREVLVGVAMARNERLEVGDRLRLGKGDWDVVGIFRADSSVFELEAWCDLDLLAADFRCDPPCSTVVLRTGGRDEAGAVVDFLDSSRSVSVKVQSEPDYYAKHAEMFRTVRTGAVVIGVFMAIGAVCGVVNTMYAAIGERVGDIAVMRLLGFSRTQVFVSFLSEALLLSLIGGIIGLLAGWVVNGLTVEAALGTKAVVVAFQVDRGILTFAALFTIAVGILGGVFPVISAMRIDPLAFKQC